MQLDVFVLGCVLCFKQIHIFNSSLMHIQYNLVKEKQIGNMYVCILDCTLSITLDPLHYTLFLLLLMNNMIEV